jgi:manganese transport protein
MHGWRTERGEASLADVHASIAVPSSGRTWRKAAAFVGPGYLVAVGYMDPGNWATSIAGGSRFGYALLFVALLSNVMAIVLQALAARLAIGSGRDLAQACRDAYPRWASLPLWLLAEIAIAATDLAEVIGTAIGLNLLFGIPITIGIAVTALDVFVVLYLQRLGFRWVESFIIALLGIIALSFAAQMVMLRPDVSAVLGGFVPTTALITDPDMLYLALGIIGATVMPHNLYLHSGLVQTRAYDPSPAGRRQALRFFVYDSTFALCFALTVNASILILAAGAFHGSGATEVSDLGDAHSLLAPLLGSALAPTLFGIALLCCGLNSTVTATLAGQIVMEGFLRIKLTPWLRRLITRLIAIVPAAAVAVVAGEAGAGKLLILSQVVLGLQLPFAVVPLVLLTADRAKMGDLAAPRGLTATAAVIAALLIGLNLKLSWDILFG